MLHILAISAALVVVQPPRPAPSQLARDLQKKYEAVRDFKADFIHTYEGGALRRKAVERGKVLIKKPGKMRWTYEHPERKLFVSDGLKVYSYLPQEGQGTVGSVPPADEVSTPALFLAGKGDLVRDFVASAPEGIKVPDGSAAIRLTPKNAEPAYDWLALVVDPRTLQIQQLITVDRQGGRSTLEFRNLKENAGLSDKEFVFKFPPGTNVVNYDKPAR